MTTDFHPASVSYGWRTQFKRAGVKYLLPNMPHTRDNYLEAVSTSGLTILEVMDIPHRELPAGYFSEEFMRLHSEKMLCLILLAQKQPSVSWGKGRRIPSLSSRGKAAPTETSSGLEHML